MKWNVKNVLKTVKDGVTLVAATKYFTADEMRELYHEGVSHFGENRVERILELQPKLQDLDITWHYIGTLQTKKVKKIINDIDYLHSLDSKKLASEIDKRRTKPLDCFIQVNISNEETKHGIDKEDLEDFMDYCSDLENITITGLMGMAALTKNKAKIKEAFNTINSCKTMLVDKGYPIKHLSIGMSNDYLIAQEMGATMIRLGSILFDKEVE